MTRTYFSTSHAEARRGHRSILPENSRVALTSQLALNDGHVLPAGSIGTIVGIWAKGAGYEVEFMMPFHAVATIGASKLKPANARS